MAKNNMERLTTAFQLLSEGLRDVVDGVMTKAYGSTDWPDAWADEDARKHSTTPRVLSKEDVQVQLRALTERGRLFSGVLSRAQQSFASELRETRNQWAHNVSISSEDTARALDTMERLLNAVDSTDSAADIRKLRSDLQRTVYEDQTRQRTKKKPVISLGTGTNLKPWREVIQPHDDVARGEFTASEFAADLHLVHTRQATSPEYGDPVEFFTRTYLTEGLRDLLSRALRRLGGDLNASPVVNLQTNFGGGKTHSMLALHHLFSGTPNTHFPQDVQDVVAACGNPDLASMKVNRVALVGTYLTPGSPNVKEDGTAVNTLWGELAWQLGGREGYDLVAADDRAGTNPGERLRTLLERTGPALILIDEWVAYARQLVTDKELPAGSFDTQFTFAQSLTEVVRSIPGAMLVVSIPASEANDGQGHDIEVGGSNGQAALERLQNVIRRVADQWRPSSKDESFEIVRRRLFRNPDAEGLTEIAATARTFVTLYRSNQTDFPREAAAIDNNYEKRIRSSYPLHPELLDRLYEDWSTLERFQRTRGVLKLVSSIVHELWAGNDRSPLILPGNVPLDATTVNTDLTQYLEDQWKPIIDSDIDGPTSTAQRIDLERPNLGQHFVTLRIARTIFMGAAPRIKSSRKGLDKQYVWLGSAVPGDALGNFGSAVELLSQRSTYFYEEQGHYWFDTQPSVTRTANDYAERLREDVETVWNEIVRRLRSGERSRGVFSRIHVAPESSTDIPDLDDTRLVIVHPRHAHRKQDAGDSETQSVIRAAIETRGSSQRVHRNTLIFLVADRGALENLEGATRSFLAWKQVQTNSDSLNLTAQQRRQTDEWVKRHDRSVTDRLRDTFVWAMYPEQEDPTRPFTLSIDRVPEVKERSLAERVETSLTRAGQLINHFGASMLGETLNTTLGEAWREAGDMSVDRVWELFTQYIHLPRLVRRSVLEEAIRTSSDTVLAPKEAFGIASGKDPDTGRYQDLVLPAESSSPFHLNGSTLLVDPQRAREQLTQDAASPQFEATTSPADVVWARPGVTTNGTRQTSPPAQPKAPDRFFGSVKVSSERYSRDIGTIIREVIDQLHGAGADVEITLDIQAFKRGGFNEVEVRTVKENTQTLKFGSSGFEGTS